MSKSSEARDGSLLTATSGIRAAMTRAPKKIALRHRDSTRTYEELLRRIDQVAAAGIGDCGLRHGQHALICANNCIEFVEVVCGLGEAGVTVATITPRVTTAELESICDDAQARVIFTDHSTDALARAAKFNTVERIICFGDDFEEWLETGTIPAVRPQISDLDPWVMGYTSGTTGGPKGVLLSHRSRVLMMYASAAEYGCFGIDHRYLVVTPLAHGGSLIRVLCALFFGGYAEIMDKFDPETVLRKLSAGRFTATAMVPTQFHAILSLSAQTLADLCPSTLRAIISHGAPMAQTMKQRIVDYFGNDVLYETYGSTEAGLVTSIRPGDQLRKEDSVGTAYSNTQLKIVDEKGNACGPGEIGELLSRSPYIFNGYWNRPKETAETLRDGWVTVSDLARRDEEGFIYIVGRKKDMVISGGVNIYPREIEDILLSHPQIADVAVVGISDAKWGQHLRAVIVLENGTQLSPSDIIGFCQGKIASHKIPKDIIFTASLPRNANGKVLKAELQSMAS